MPPTVKISQLPKQSTPTVNDKVPIVSGNTTDYAVLSDLITLFFGNIPTGVIPGSIFPYVVSGGVWTADSAGVNRNASMTAITIYINDASISIGAVTARTFTASKDTYIDILDNLDGTGTIVYTEVANNAASPALASNSVRIGIIVTAAGSIVAAASVNQGQEDRVLPIASSIPYAVTDSLGNLICPRDPNRRLLGYRQKVSNQNITTDAVITELVVPVIIPTGRKVTITIMVPNWNINSGTTGLTLTLRNGTTTGGTQLNQLVEFNVTASTGKFAVLKWTGTLVGSQNFCATAAATGGTLALSNNSTVISSIAVELA